MLLCILTSTCASRRNSVRFFNIPTSKNVFNPSVFHTWLGGALRATMVCTFFDMWTSKSGPNVFLTFWLGNVFRATTAVIFLISQLPKVVRPWCACAFWVRHVLSATTVCHFSSLIWPAGSAPAALASHKTFENRTQCFATFLPFRALGSSSFWLSLTFSSLTFFFLFFSSLTFSLTFFFAFHLSKKRKFDFWISLDDMTW